VPILQCDASSCARYIKNTAYLERPLLMERAERDAQIAAARTIASSDAAVAEAAAMGVSARQQ
jgi:hypothetical protein